MKDEYVTMIGRVWKVRGEIQDVLEFGGGGK